MYIRTLLIAFALVTLFAAPCKAQVPQPKTFEDSLAYVVGIDIAKNLAQMGITLNPEMLSEGYRAQRDGQSVLSDEKIAAVMAAFQQKAMEKMAQNQPEAAPQSDPQKLAMCRSWLEENGKKQGVMTTASGLQYKVLVKGKKKGESPSVMDEVTVHYEGHTIDGKEFDSSYKRGEPTTFPLNRVIMGWQEGVQLMKPGAKYEFYVPSELAYGPQGMPPVIGPDELLIFTIELISVQKTAK